jgi:hypothetical protein
MVKISCPKCEAKKVYRLSRGKRKCSQRTYEFSPHRLPLYLPNEVYTGIASRGYVHRLINRGEKQYSNHEV